MAQIGLRDLFFAKVTSEDGQPETYELPVRLAKAITVKLSTTLAEAILYADDGVDDISKEFVSCEMEINCNDISDEHEALLLGQRVDENGVVHAAEGDSPPYVAIMFRAKKSRPANTYKYVCLYKGQFGIPDEDYQTKGGSVEYKTPTIKGVFIKRDKDGEWKANKTVGEEEAIAKAWFTKVYENGTTIETGGEEEEDI